MRQDPNIATVELVAHALGDLCDDFVLVGGCTVGLLITDLARPTVRATQDVDLIVEVATMVDYYELQEKLKVKGFREEGGEVICRWIKGGLMIDVMPTKEIGLGFSNRWYPHAIRNAHPFSLPGKSIINVVSAPLFIATKIESFHGRGNGDYIHHDIEDIVNVIDGRVELIDEVVAVGGEVRDFIMEEFDDLLADPTFIERLPWHLNGSDQSRIDLLIGRMRLIAGL